MRKRVSKKVTRGRCKWCMETKRLLHSHLIAKWMTEEARDLGKTENGAIQLYAWDRGNVSLEQSPPREYLLCEECEKMFSKTEGKAQRNLKRMVINTRTAAQGGRQREWMSTVSGLAVPTMGPPPEHGMTSYKEITGAEGHVWRLLITINAWRTAASEKGETLGLQGYEGMLRETIEEMREGEEGMDVVRTDYVWQARESRDTEETRAAEKCIFELPRIHEVDGGERAARLRTICGEYQGSIWTILLPRTVRSMAIPRALVLPNDGVWLVPEVDISAPDVQAKLRARWNWFEDMDERLNKGKRLS